MLARRLITFLASAYPCESLFSAMNFVKNDHRARRTYTHLHKRLRVAVNGKQPRLNSVVKSKP